MKYAKRVLDEMSVCSMIADSGSTVSHHFQDDQMILKFPAI